MKMNQKPFAWWQRKTKRKVVKILRFLMDTIDLWELIQNASENEIISDKMILKTFFKQ